MSLSSFRRELPVVITALLMGLMLAIWQDFGPSVLLVPHEVQLRMIELYVQVIGVLFGFYGVIITLHTRRFSYMWRCVPVLMFLLFILLELVSFSYVAGIPCVEGITFERDVWVYLANYMFLMGIFTFGFSLVMILRKESPD